VTVANIGSGLLAFLSTRMQNVAGRQVALGSLLYKLVGRVLIIPVLDSFCVKSDASGPGSNVSRMLM
jgi:phosphate:Na+ symporter